MSDPERLARTRAEVAAAIAQMPLEAKGVRSGDGAIDGSASDTTTKICGKGSA